MILSVAARIAELIVALILVPPVPRVWKQGWQRDSSEVAKGFPAGWQPEWQPGFHECFMKV